MFEDPHLGEGKKSAAIALTKQPKDKPLIKQAIERMAEGVLRT